MTKTGIGVDWASGYWVAVEYGAKEELEVKAFPSILNVWHEYRDRADRILVDIPIGLSDGKDSAALDDGRRLCDQRARDRLDPPLTSSVFPVPCRGAVYADDYEEAKRANLDALGKGLGCQSWSLVPRIQETDIFLRDIHTDGPEVRESHPEVCFESLANLVDEDLSVTRSKSEETGISERVDVLEACDSNLAEKYRIIRSDLNDDGEHASWKRRITSTRLDDVLDAMTLAVTASRDDDHLDWLPEERSSRPRDGEKLPMEIVFPVE